MLLVILIVVGIVFLLWEGNEEPEMFNTNSSLQEQYARLERELHIIKNDIKFLKVENTTYVTNNIGGKNVVNGWFVQFHNVIDSPSGVLLGEEINKIYGSPVICFSSRTIPFVGPSEKPYYFPKSEKIGFRAMTVWKVPKTGIYDFKILSDDGSKLYYQQVSPTIFANEKNVTDNWNLLIDAWVDQAEIWLYSKKINFNENDLVFIRYDYYEMTGRASSCIKLRTYNEDNNNTEENMPYNDIYCSLIWIQVPLLGTI